MCGLSVSASWVLSLSSSPRVTSHPCDALDVHCRLASRKQMPRPAGQPPFWGHLSAGNEPADSTGGAGWQGWFEIAATVQIPVWLFLPLLELNCVCHIQRARANLQPQSSHRPESEEGLSPAGPLSAWHLGAGPRAVGSHMHTQWGTRPQHPLPCTLWSRHLWEAKQMVSSFALS